MNTKKIVITGGPGTGKTSIINNLINRGHNCLEEVSRQVTLSARESGIEQLFLTEPLLFSELLLKERKAQFIEASNLPNGTIFLDRGIPDIVAYMDYIGDNYPKKFVKACKNNVYDYVFILAPWQDIFISDSERYENFYQSIEIHEHLVNTYTKYGYKLIDVPFNSVDKRVDYILKTIEK